MGEGTTIEWTQHTWNPWQGCEHASAGCDHCYMFSDKVRYGQDPNVVVRSKPPTFNAPLKLRDPGMVFTCSWSDWPVPPDVTLSVGLVVELANLCLTFGGLARRRSR